LLSNGFKSLSYRSRIVYNFLTARLYDQKYKFRIIGKLIGKNKEVLDLPCGTGKLTRYLHPSVEYEGWDLNRHFLNKLYKDFYKQKLNLKNFILKEKNIFDFHDYPNSQKDIIIFCDILHHVYPNHLKLVANAKNHAKKLIICEPIAANPRHMHMKNLRGPIGKTTLFITKLIPEKIFKMLDFLFADNDGINSYDDRNDWHHNKVSLIEFYKSLGINRTYHLKGEVIGVWEA
jgi:SAM-dependent methyltransferase